MKKSKREKEKEKEEAKKREEEELAAKAYAEYVEAFEGESVRRKGTGFVRAGTSAAQVDEGVSYNPKSQGSSLRAFERERSTVRVLVYY